MVKIKRKAAPVKGLRLGPQVEDEEYGEPYWPLVGDTKGVEYYVGQNKQGWFVYDPEDDEKHLYGWAWYKDSKTLLRNFDRFLNADEPMPKVKGEKDPNIKGAILVPLEDMPAHPRIPLVADLPMLPDSKTYYRLVDGEFSALVTVDVKGLHLGWDGCGGCNRRVTRCECIKGATPPRSIIWCVVGASTGWEDQGPVARSIPSVKDPVSVPPARSGPKAVPAPKNKQKAADKPTDALTAALDGGDLDMGAVTAAAEASATATTKAVRKIKVRRK